MIYVLTSMTFHQRKRKTPESLIKSIQYPSVHTEEKLTEIRQIWKTPDANSLVCILVEGDDDEKIFQKFFDNERTWIEIADGKEELRKILKELSCETKQIIGILDADFSNLKNEKPDLDCLFLTDCHDIEMTILRDGEIRANIFAEYTKLKELKNIFDNILENASYMGYLHWYNHETNCGYSFDGIFYKYDTDKIAQEKQKIIDIINAQSPDKKQELKKEDIDNFISQKNTCDIYNLCNGHDVIILFMKRFALGKRAFYTALRLSFQKPHFMRTNLYAALSCWQQRSGFTLFGNTELSVAKFST